MPIPEHRSSIFTAVPWLAALAVIILLSMATYTCSQQVLRSDANDPQAQLAQDAAARLAAGASPSAVLPAGSVDVAASLAPWLAIADLATGPLASNGDLNGHAPRPPRGVLELAQHEGEHRVTWRPAPGLRIALVAVAVPGPAGRVAYSGRSLRETEERTRRIGRIVLLAWAAASGVVLVAWAFTAWARGDAPG